MNHLLQVARRTGKSAVGFKVQLVIHRMNAHLSNFNGAELVAVMTRHKKKAMTKSAPYQSSTKEVVWGDILPFSCTLYMAKTGLFQAKLFQIQVYDTRNDQNVATFEFDLAELVQCDKDAGKESILIATSKCQDPRASLSLTVISSRVLHFGGSRKGSGGYGDHEGSEMSFDGSRSELSVSTMESRTSATSSHHQHSHEGKVPPGAVRKGPDNTKANGLRGAFPAVDENEMDEQEGITSVSETQNQTTKHQELMRTIQDLENELRQSESANVRLKKAGDEKDLRIERLQTENEELGVEVESLRRKLLEVSSGTRVGSRAGGDDSDGVMQVDFIQYMSLKEENDKLQRQVEALKAMKRAAESPTKHTSRPAATKDDDDDASSDASSADEYLDAQEPQLLAEISDLKHSVSVLSGERDELNASITSLLSDNKQLLAEVKELTSRTHELVMELEAKDEALTRAKAGAADVAPPVSVNEIGGESESDEQEARLSEVTVQNERLVQQLSHLDVVVTKLKDEKSSLLDKLEHAESANERALHDIARAQLTIAELREQVHEISAQLAASQQDLRELKHGELAASVAATAAAVAKNQEVQERLTELRQQNDELQTRVLALEEKLVRAEASGEAKATELQCQMEQLKHEAETLREELEQLRVSKQQAEDELFERTATLKDALETQRRLTIGHDEERTQLAMSNEEMRARVELKTAEAQTLSSEWRQKVETLEQENDYFQRELIDSKMKLAELTQQNDEMAAQIKKMEKSVVEMKIQAAEKDLKGAKKK
ncbi:hypothetical protein PybrP1_003090 [[Pythium] brassicae (nom. inval.)]|nr:hypothetical protein PybrP1_003090 [[Pythium] brassicae (nom. inval.)]